MFIILYFIIGALVSGYIYQREQKTIDNEHDNVIMNIIILSIIWPLIVCVEFGAFIFRLFNGK